MDFKGVFIILPILYWIKGSIYIEALLLPIIGDVHIYRHELYEFFMDYTYYTHWIL